MTFPRLKLHIYICDDVIIILKNKIVYLVSQKVSEAFSKIHFQSKLATVIIIIQY